MDGCGPARPAAGPVLAPLMAAGPVLAPLNPRPRPRGADGRVRSGSAGRGTLPGSAQSSATSTGRGWTGAVRLRRPRDPSWLRSILGHVHVAWMDGCGPAPPAAGPVLAPLNPRPRPRRADGRVRSGSAGRGTRPGSAQSSATSTSRGWTGAVRLRRPRDPSWLRSWPRDPSWLRSILGHVHVARMDGCGPAPPAAGPVLAPLNPQPAWPPSARCRPPAPRGCSLHAPRRPARWPRS
jgi:hypothetical protein